MSHLIYDWCLGMANMVYILDDLSYFFINTAWNIFGDSMHSTLTRLARTSNLYTSGGFLRICFPPYSDSNTHNHFEEDTPTIIWHVFTFPLVIYIFTFMEYVVDVLTSNRKFLFRTLYGTYAMPTYLVIKSLPKNIFCLRTIVLFSLHPVSTMFPYPIHK